MLITHLLKVLKVLHGIKAPAQFDPKTNKKIVAVNGKIEHSMRPNCVKAILLTNSKTTSTKFCKFPGTFCKSLVPASKNKETAVTTKKDTKTVSP